MEHVDVAVVGLGALGSATIYHLAHRGVDVVGFEQFDLGHVRGASHDTSRIVRRAYESPEYVRLADAAFRDWAELEAATGETLLTHTGGLTFCPPHGRKPASDYVSSLRAVGCDVEELDAAAVTERFPAFRVPEGVTAVFDPSSGIAHASRTVATLQMHARVAGARLRPRCPVSAVDDSSGDGVVLSTAAGPVHASTVVLCADAWTNQLLAPLDAAVPLRVMQEQVTYFAPARPADFEPGRFPVWIWDGEICFYGFPTYGEPTIKAARDVSELLTDPDQRSFVPDPGRLEELCDFMAATIPGSGPALRTVTCQYTLTPDRDFVIDAVPGHPSVLLGLGAAHAFKFTPTFGRVLADLATTGSSNEDLSLFRADRPALAPAGVSGAATAA
jgi:sarcosine oxidase